MEDLTELKNYLKKLQNVIVRDADFKFFGKVYIKKNKVDDVWCCILASLPDIFKKSLKNKNGRKLNSIISYNHLFETLKMKCFFSTTMYSVKKDEAIKSILAILSTIEKDITYLEKNS